MKNGRNTVRIRWTKDPITDTLALPRAEGERVFRMRTGLDPHTLEPLDVRAERGPVVCRRGSVLTLMLAVALDREVATRKARRTGTIRIEHLGRPQLGLELQQLLRLTVETVSGPANAALYIGLSGLNQSRAHICTQPETAAGPEDDCRDAKAAYELLTKRLDVIEKGAKELPKLTEMSIGTVDLGRAA